MTARPDADFQILATAPSSQDAWLLLRFRDERDPGFQPADVPARVTTDGGDTAWRFENHDVLRARDAEGWLWAELDAVTKARLSDTESMAAQHSADEQDSGSRVRAPADDAVRIEQTFGGAVTRYVTHDAIGRKAFMAAFTSAGWQRRAGEAGGALHLERDGSTLSMTDARSVESAHDRRWRIAFTVDGTGEAPSPIGALGEGDVGYEARAHSRTALDAQKS